MKAKPNQRREIKYCELCGELFVRKANSEQIDCGRCLAMEKITPKTDSVQ